VGLFGRKETEALVKWFFLISFVAALIICAFLMSFIIFALATRGAGGYKVVLFFLPQVVLFGWAAKTMFRSFKGIGLDE
jgi:hypothetical protein